VKRAVITFALTIAAAAAILPAPAAGAQTSPTTTSAEHGPQFAGPPVPFYSDISLLGGLVSEPGGKTRPMTASQANGFMQSWFVDSVFGHPPQVRPPAGLPRSTVKIGARVPEGDYEITVYYADDGTNVWVGMPPQALPGIGGVERENWIQPQNAAKVRAGFQGTFTPTVQSPPTTAAAHAKHRGGSALSWILVAIGAVIVIGLGIVLVRRALSRAHHDHPDHRGGQRLEGDADVRASSGD
jgi:hypothetical protein